jgi:glycerol-3-phosphate acyltransferase PlsX
MGGDNAPKDVIRGLNTFLRDNEDTEIILVGDEAQITHEMEKDDFKHEVEIIHTDEWITMDDSPKKALAEKKSASLHVATKILRDGKADVIVSGGNTGALVLASAQNLPMIDGIERSALAAIFPAAKFIEGSHGFSLLLDVGATLKCSAKQLVHFAYMGSYYLSHVMNVDNPRVALLNNGSEETKGGEILTKTYQYLKNDPNINFYGNIEGNEINKGIVDVIISEGFVGNVIIKMMEGTAELLHDTGKYAFKKKISWKLGIAFLASGLKKLKSRADYSEYGGVPILGFLDPVIKAHGRSNAKAFYNAYRVASIAVKSEVTKHITESVHAFNQGHQIDDIYI